MSVRQKKKERKEKIPLAKSKEIKDLGKNIYITKDYSPCV